MCGCVGGWMCGRVDVARVDVWEDECVGGWMCGMDVWEGGCVDV